MDLFIELFVNPRYAPMRAAAWGLLAVLYIVVMAMLQTAADYFFIEMVRANVSTSTLLLYRVVERALFE